VRALVELEDGLAGLEMVARQDAGLLELHQHAVHGRQAHVAPSPISSLNTSSALRCRRVVFWKISSTLMRGSVAFSPLF